MAIEKKVRKSKEVPILKEVTRRKGPRARRKSNSEDTKNARAWSKMDPYIRKLSQAILRFGIKGRSLNNFSHSFTPKRLDKGEDEA